MNRITSSESHLAMSLTPRVLSCCGDPSFQLAPRIATRALAPHNCISHARWRVRPAPSQPIDIAISTYQTTAKPHGEFQQCRDEVSTSDPLPRGGAPEVSARLSLLLFTHGETLLGEALHGMEDSRGFVSQIHRQSASHSLGKEAGTADCLLQHTYYGT